MTSPAGPRAAAVRIGADVLTHPRHARWARPLSCRDTTERLSRLCQAAGVLSQQVLLGPGATMARARAAIAASAAGTGPGGLLVVTFSGHSERPVPGEHDGGWCLHDAALRHCETAGLLAAAPASAHIVIIAGTCYAAACAANQATLNYQHSELVKKLERLTYPGGSPQPGLRQLRLAPPGTAQGHPRRRTARGTRQPPGGHPPAPLPARLPVIALSTRKEQQMHAPPMPGRWTAAAYTCLTVALYVAAPAVVTLTVADHVQLDRVTGASAERHGGLIPPGTTPVHLTAGTYLFRTTADAQVQLPQDAAVTVTAVQSQSDDKDKWPDPLPASRGDGPPDHVPALTVLR